jgi:hypothetical protein
VSKISKEHIEILRNYFLSHDEGIRRNIRKEASQELLDNIALVESIFIQDEPLVDSDLLTLRNEYFISLAETLQTISLTGNPDIEKLLSSNNQTFKKLLEEMAVADSFEEEVKIAIKAVERDELRKRFQLIDKEEDEFEISDNELKTAITSVERESMKKQFIKIDKADEGGNVIKLFVRYAVAAALIGAIIGGAYIGFFNNSNDNQSHTAKKDTINSSKPLVADIELPNLIESSEKRKSILSDQRGSAFAGGINENDTITIISNIISKQLDTLRSLSALSTIIKESELRNKISYQLDSLSSLLNTYTYSYDLKRITINLNYRINVNNIVLLKPISPKDLYIKLNDNYYLIISSTSPQKLTPVTDKNKLEELQKIEFLNE